MIPDIKIKDYYLQYVYDTKEKLNIAKENTQKLNERLNMLFNYIYSRLDKIKNVFGLDLSYYKEWTNKEYDCEDRLKNKINELIKNTNNSDDKNLLVQIFKYITTLNEIHYNENLINIYSKIENLTLKDYKKYVKEYYQKVHKVLLEGYGYKFTDEIGTLVICNFKLVNPKENKMIDFAETNKRKKQLLAEGKRLYNEKEALWYESRNLPYDGVDYRMYKNDTNYYEFLFHNSRGFDGDTIEYQRTTHTDIKLKKYSQVELADLFCKTFEDIVYLPVDIKVKLNIYLHKYPQNALNFIRNDEQTKLKYRTDNC